MYGLDGNVCESCSKLVTTCNCRQEDWEDWEEGWDENS